jgi:glycosyltransferase involved in cell wall biosynthesis
MTAPLFTVLIDTFNYGKYIEEAVRSVLEQDFPKEQVEILVVDDGSTDDTEERLKQFGDAIRYLKKPNGGQASAFNFGWKHARGEFIALLDADDVWLPKKLSRMHQVFVSHPETGMAFHRLLEWTEDGELSTRDHFIGVPAMRVPDSRFWLLCYPMMQASSLVFRRAALEDLLPIPEVLRTQADAYLTALIIFICPVAGVDEYLAKYRIHGANLFHSGSAGPQPTPTRLQSRMAMRESLVGEIREWLRKHGLDSDSADIRDYLKQWRKAQEADGFALEPPGRWKYFRHAVEFPMLYRIVMNPRERRYSYLRSAVGLVLGYRRMYLFDTVYVWLRKRLNRKNVVKEETKGFVPGR